MLPNRLPLETEDNSGNHIEILRDETTGEIRGYITDTPILNEDQWWPHEHFHDYFFSDMDTRRFE